MQANTKFSPFMILNRYIPKFMVENHLSMFTQEIDVEIRVEKMVEQVIAKMELIIEMHKTIIENVKKVQQKQKKIYALRKDLCSMKKPSKKKSLEAN